MGRIKEQPRYNVISCRVSDETRRHVESALGDRTVQDFLHAAIEEKMLRDKWKATDSRFAELYEQTVERRTA